MLYFDLVVIGHRDFFLSCPLCFCPYSRLCPYLLHLFILFHSCCSHAQVFGKTLANEFPISYSYHWIVHFFAKWHDRNIPRAAWQKRTIIIIINSFFRETRWSLLWPRWSLLRLWCFLHFFTMLLHFTDNTKLSSFSLFHISHHEFTKMKQNHVFGIFRGRMEERQTLNWSNCH